MCEFEAARLGVEFDGFTEIRHRNSSVVNTFNQNTPFY
jgi:hypothetical protein